MHPYMANGSQGGKKSQTLRTDVRTSAAGALFPEDAQAMVVESQYDDVDRAAHRPSSALKIASQLAVLETAFCMTSTCAVQVSANKSWSTLSRFLLPRYRDVPDEIPSEFSFRGLINDRQEKCGCPIAILPYVPLEFQRRSALTSNVGGDCRGIPSHRWTRRRYSSVLHASGSCKYVQCSPLR